MADKNKNNYLYIGIAVVVVIVLAIVFISNSNNNFQNEVTCNSPYIKVGTSCCLDQNYNSVCDNDETPEQNQQTQQEENTEPEKLQVGDSCSFGSDCESGYCVHDICRQSSTYCGDNYCDSGESRSSCSQDCLREISLSGVSPKAICESYDGWVVSENGNSQIAEYNPENGQIIFEYSIGSPEWSVDCLRNNNLLVIGFDNTDSEYQVQEIDHSGNVIKRLTPEDLGCSADHALLYGSNWLISCYDSDTSQYKIMEVNPNTKNILSTKYAEDVRDIFVKDSLYGYASADTIYLYKGEGYGFQTQAYLSGEAIISISVLENGNYLISGSGVKEVDDSSGDVVKETYAFGGSEYDAEELSNGNWLILTNSEAVEINPNAVSSSSGGVSSIVIVQN